LRALDDNEQAQRRSQRDQDGSEIRSVELERLIAEGLTLIERRNAFEFMRPGGRLVRTPERLNLATVIRIDCELLSAHRGNDQRPGFPRGQAAC